MRCKTAHAPVQYNCDQPSPSPAGLPALVLHEPPSVSCNLEPRTSSDTWCPHNVRKGFPAAGRCRTAGPPNGDQQRGERPCGLGEKPRGFSEEISPIVEAATDLPRPGGIKPAAS